MDNARIATSSVQESLVRQINLNQRTLVKLQEQLSTGRKVSKPEDDPVVVGRTIRRESQKAELAQYNTNNVIAQTVVSTSQLHLDEIRNLADLALGIANSTGDATTAVELDGYRRQLEEVLNQALDMANGKLDGEYLFAGVDYSGDPYTIDDGGTPADPSDDTIVYNGSPTDRTDPNFDEAEVYVGNNTKLATRLNPEHNDDIQAMLQNLLDLRNAYDTNIAPFSQSNTDAIAARIEQSDDQLLIASSDLITKEMRLDLARKADSTYFAQLDASIANEVAADTTEIAVQIKQAEIAYQASLTSASRLLNISLLNYI